MTVLGRGIVGLAIARRLARAGLRVLLVGRPNSKIADASRAAVGVSTVKGQLNPVHPLFDLKLRGHDRLPGWLTTLSRESGLPIRQLWGDVYEPWASPDHARWLGHRIFHREFRGFMRSQDYVSALPTKHGDWPYQGYLQHHEDGWFHPQDAIAALEAIAAAHKNIELLNERINAFEITENQVDLIGSGFTRTTERLILATGWETDLLLRQSQMSTLNLEAVGGSTFAGELDLRTHENRLAEPFVLVHRMMNASWQKGLLRLGSDSHIVHKPEDNLGKDPGISSDLKSWFDEIGKGRAQGSWEWGLRTRLPDRLPVLGPWGKAGYQAESPLILATGAYKNGLQIADSIAEGIESLLLTKALPSFLDPFASSRLSPA